MDELQASKLATSNDMVPVEGSVEVEIPADVLWDLFARPNLWPRWNPCFLWALNSTLVKDETLLWCFGPIKKYYPYVMPATATIIELEPGRKVTWEVTALPGFYAQHTYSIEPIGANRARFRSWENATGKGFLRMKRFWLAHFNFVKERSLAGARTLEQIYQRDGNLYSLIEPTDRLVALKDNALTAISAAAPLWFYQMYVRPSVATLAPGVHAVLGGGGNSLVVESAGEALIVDTKFPPGSNHLAKWVKKNVPSPVTKIVNTHYHYDHTQGNENYPHASIIAHALAPDLMLQQDGEFWSRHQAGLPSVGVRDSGQTITIGKKSVQLFYPGPAHTRADLVAYLPDDNILATGDLFFHTYYPFFDPSRAGVSIPGLVTAIRTVADRFPTARVVPGHGPIATIDDLRAYAAYLEHLFDAVARAIAAGQSEHEAVRTIALSGWKRKVLPSFHGARLAWGTRENNIRNVYRVLVAQRVAGPAKPGMPLAATGPQITSEGNPS